MNNTLLPAFSGVIGNIYLSIMATGADIRDEVSAWATLIGSLAITAVTIGIQIYHLIRDRDKDKNKGDTEESLFENTDEENSEK